MTWAAPLGRRIAKDAESMEVLRFAFVFRVVLSVSLVGSAIHDGLIFQALIDGMSARAGGGHQTDRALDRRGDGSLRKVKLLATLLDPRAIVVVLLVLLISAC